MRHTFIIILLFCVSSFGFERTPDITIHWNKFTDLKSIDGYIIGLNEQGIAIFEFDGNTDKLIELNHLVLSTTTKSMKLQGTVLIVRMTNNELTFVDIGNLPECTILGGVCPLVEYSDYELANDTVYLSRWFDGIDKYELLSFSELVFIENFKPGVVMTQLKHDNLYLYGLDRYNGVVGIPTDQSLDTLYLNIPERPYYFYDLGPLFIVSLNSEGFYFGAADDTTGHLLLRITGFPSPLRVIEYENYMVLISSRQIDVTYGAKNTSEIIYPIDGPLTGGDTLTINGNGYLLLPNANNGITAFNILIEEEPLELLAYGSATSAVVANDNVLFTGGESNPLEMYVVENESISSPVQLDNAQNGASDLMTSGRFLYALISSKQKLRAFDISDINGMIDVVDSADITMSGAISLESFYVSSVNVDLLLVVGKTAIDVFSIESGMITYHTTWQFEETIADCAISNSMLYVSDRFGAIAVYDIEPNFDLIECGRRDLTGTGWKVLPFNDETLVFSGNTMTKFMNCLVVDTILHLPLPVLDAEIINDTLFTIGASGIAKYDISGSLPQFIESGGLSGGKLSVGDGFITTTDGSSVNVYFRNTTVYSGDEFSRVSGVILHNNYPEPFNSTTVIQFELPVAQSVTLTLYNILGQEVTTLVDESVQAGTHAVQWDGKDDLNVDVATGIYFYKLQTEKDVFTSKMMLIR